MARTPIFVLLALLIATPAAGKSVHQEFIEAWTTRDQAYRADYDARLDVATKSIEAFSSAVVGGEPPEHAASLFKKAMDDVFVAAEARGRGIMMQQLHSFAKKKPSPAAGELWLQERMSELQRQADEARQLGEAIEPTRKTNDLAKTINAIQSFIQMSGMVKGAAEELTLIDRNLSSYYQGKAAQSAERQARFRAMLGGMAQALQAGAQQQSQSFTSFPLTTRCNTWNTQTTCTTQ